MADALGHAPRCGEAAGPMTWERAPLRPTARSQVSSLASNQSIQDHEEDQEQRQTAPHQQGAVALHPGKGTLGLGARHGTVVLAHHDTPVPRRRCSASADSARKNVGNGGRVFRREEQREARGARSGRRRGTTFGRDPPRQGRSTPPHSGKLPAAAAAPPAAPDPRGGIGSVPAGRRRHRATLHPDGRPAPHARASSEPPCVRRSGPNG